MGITCYFNERVFQSRYVAMVLDADDNVLERIYVPNQRPLKLHGVRLPFFQTLMVEIGGSRTHLVLLGMKVAIFINPAIVCNPGLL